MTRGEEGHLVGVGAAHEQHVLLRVVHERVGVHPVGLLVARARVDRHLGQVVAAVAHVVAHVPLPHHVALRVDLEHRLDVQAVLLLATGAAELCGRLAAELVRGEGEEGARLGARVEGRELELVVEAVRRLVDARREEELARRVVRGDMGRAAGDADVVGSRVVVLEAHDVAAGREVDGVASAVRRAPAVHDVAAGGVDQPDVGGGVRRDEQVAGLLAVALEEAERGGAPALHRNRVSATNDRATRAGTLKRPPGCPPAAAAAAASTADSAAGVDLLNHVRTGFGAGDKDP